VRFENDLKEAKKIKKRIDELRMALSGVKEQINRRRKIDSKKEIEMGRITAKLPVPEKLVKYTEKIIMMEPMINNAMRELDLLDQYMKDQEQERKDKAKNLEKTKKEIENLTEEVKRCSSDIIIDREISKIREKEQQLEDEIQTLSVSKTDYYSKDRILQQTLEQTQRTLIDLRDAEIQKMNQLKEKNRDCYGAVMYMRQHMPYWRQSGRFKHGIHEPAVLTLTVPNLDNAVYIEKETGGQQLEAFVCEDAREANDLMQELRQRFQRISVIHGDLKKMAQYKGPHGERFRARPRAKDLEKYKFVDYVGDMFNG